MKKPKTYNLIPLTPARFAALQALARRPEGATAESDAVHGALWPTLVAMNLAQRLPRTERERGTPARYRLLPAGEDLAGAGASGARTEARR